MKKRKLILIVAATAAAVVLCAGLPKLTAKFMDKQGEEDAPVYSDLHTVNIEAIEQKTNSPIMAKLALCAKGTAVDIDPMYATKTQDEIKACIDGFFDACEEAGFHQRFTPATEMLSPKRLYKVSDPSDSIIVWTYFALKSGPIATEKGESQSVQVDSFEEDPAESRELRTVEMLIDDETGKILSVSYNLYGVSYSHEGIYERNRERVEPLTDVYFTQLELMESAEKAEAFPGSLYDYQETDMGVTDVYYTLLDNTYGTVQIFFEVGGLETFRVSVWKEK